MSKQLNLKFLHKKNAMHVQMYTYLYILANVGICFVFFFLFRRKLRMIRNIKKSFTNYINMYKVKICNILFDREGPGNPAEDRHVCRGCMQRYWLTTNCICF